MGPKTSAAVATMLWGFTYVVSTTLLPHNPLLVAAVRALGGAFALLLLARHLPPPGWWNKLIVLGTLNAGLFFALLFISAMRLPGGVAAIFQALGPLFAILLGWAILKMKPSLLKIASVLIGVAGVALVVLKGDAGLDAIGVAAALGGTLSLALGGVLMNKWGKPPISMLAFTGWQLLVAGMELLLVALLAGDWPNTLTATNVAGFVILAVLLTAVPFVLWFGAIAKVGVVVVAPFFLLVPITAFVLDALIKGFVPTGLQIVGAVIVVAGLLLSQWVPKAQRQHRRKTQPRHPAKHS
ncbi:DMT family transporter [Polaromonas sp. SM01]|uniref:DMT family transporter n=1 Tax=Polaromonas sp. SM01 TaxID=3085630 RepID=UPI00298292B4|nr:DMT family transporter [Polaromonas sp. SM01]MDW5441159.1 DMT family transporter [Polaromonas sp. SM01]